MYKDNYMNSDRYADLFISSETRNEAVAVQIITDYTTAWNHMLQVFSTCKIHDFPKSKNVETGNRDQNQPHARKHLLRAKASLT